MSSIPLLFEVKSSEVVSSTLFVDSRRRAKCSLETPVANVEVFEVEEKKPELLTAWPDGPQKMRNRVAD